MVRKPLFEGLKAQIIYVFRICDEAHAGCLKVGMTEATDSPDTESLPPNSPQLNDLAHHRIDQYTQTAAIPYDLLHTEVAVRHADGKVSSFTDHDVHQVLERSGIRRKVFPNVVKQGREWFETDLATVRRAIAAAKEGRGSLTGSEVSQGMSPIEFRPEQRTAIDMTVRRFRHGNDMLWNAKMRFGKTLSALQVAREMGVRRTLILTHRPTVNTGWFDDFRKIFYDRDDYRYGSRLKGETFADLVKSPDSHFVYFASMQDLRGSETVGGSFDKNSEIFTTEWDLIIVDEAHEGTRTSLGQKVVGELRSHGKPKVLQLSGTPYNLMHDYAEDEIYTWSYIDEQRAKAEWDATHMGDHNPYACLPCMNIYTYDLGRLMGAFADEDISFNFHEFFRTGADGRFLHEADVASFLNLLTRTDDDCLYPFSNESYRHIFRHTLWMLPGVKAARALSVMLKSHPVFQHFTVVNVAGDGDDGEDRGDALQMVSDAIGDDPATTWTITLSCGRLTTGVSVKAWTGVLMLSGGYKTSTATYMQTIFRVQTPATIGGRVKDQCYVFDFAPDRTLQVIAESAAGNAGKDVTPAQRRRLGELLNFCPVIAITGSTMKAVDSQRLLQDIKRAYVERVVNRGFEDNSLYNSQLLDLSADDLSEIDGLRGIIGEDKAQARTQEVTVNDQGLDNEEREELENLKKKDKKELSPEEKARLEELKKKMATRRNVISVLRCISIRMPLLIYGADIADEQTELTIDNFTNIVDDRSWEEFMPSGVTKSHFKRIKRYYDPDVFAAAGRRIREKVRAADRVGVEERIGRIAQIFATFRNPDKETVLTPWRVVNMHLGETLGGYCFFGGDNYDEPLAEPRFIDRGAVTATVFAPAARVLEINSKSGLYPLYVAYNAYRSLVKDLVTSLDAADIHRCHVLWDEAVRWSVFVICKTPMARQITVRTLTGFRQTATPVHAHYVPNLLSQIRTTPSDFVAAAGSTSFWNVKDNDNDMKFKAVVGNPPYQEEGANTRKAPIYHLFYELAFRLADCVTLITPGRFLFRAGQTPDAWMDKILADPHFRVVRYFKRSADVFPTVDIKGGVVITWRDANADFGPVGQYSEYPELDSILRKVAKRGEKSFASLVSSKGLYKFSDLLFEEHPRAREVQGKGSASQITSRSLEDLPEVFLEVEPAGQTYIQMLGLSKAKRVIRWIRRDYVKPVESLDHYKVLIPKANGSGTFGEVLSKPIIGKPTISHTVTFISIGDFVFESEAEACLKYVKTKFARALLGTLKVTQDNPRDTWQNVPIQNFTSKSDIDWKADVAGVDRQLYKKYGFSEAEIEFIETNIRPMA